MMYPPRITDNGVFMETGVLTSGSTASGSIIINGGAGWAISTTELSTFRGCAKECKPVKYLYKAYVIVKGAVLPELPPIIAKDENTAIVKAILLSQANPDDAHVILQELGEVPDKDE